MWLIVTFVADLKMRWALGSLLLALAHLAHPSSSSARRNSRRMLISEAPTASEYVNVQEGRQGRQIQPLACVSKSGGEKGVCMFAWNCVEAGGQHLGTCIDRLAVDSHGMKLALSLTFPQVLLRQLLQAGREQATGSWSRKL